MRLLAAILALAPAIPLAAQEKTDTALQQQLQKRVQAEADQTVRRINTMLRALSFHRLDTAEENRVLEQIAVSLAGLSKDQMTEVISRLQSAAKVSDPAKSQAELAEAYARHREILDALNRLLARYDALRSLDQAAERLEKIALDQVDLFLQTVQLSRVAQQIAAVEKAAEGRTDEKRSNDEQRALERDREGRNRVRTNIHALADRLADDESDVQRNVSEVLTQLGELKKSLPAEQVERLAKAEAMAKDRQVTAAVDEAAKKLRNRGAADQRYAQWKAATFLQWKVAGDVKELARALRSPVEDVEALREARQQLDRVILTESALKVESAIPAESREPAALERRGQEFGNRQARVEFETRDTRVLLKPRSEPLAGKVFGAESILREAQDALRDSLTPQAGAAQDKALAILREVLAEIDKMIAKAEQGKQDPVTALQKVAETIEKLIQDQKETKEKTEQTKAKEELPKLVPPQQDLQARTNELKQQPLPDKAEIAPALEKAEKAMEKAANALDAKKAPDATAKQEQAIKALEEAKAAVNEALAEAQKAQQDALPTAAQQVAKAIEQAQAAQQAANEAAKPSPQEKGKPSLAEMQKQLAKDAQQQGLKGAQPADAAAQALQEGNLPQAVQQQKQALAQLQAAAQEGQQPGEKGQQPGEKGQQPGEKGQQPGEKGQQPGEKGQQPGEKGPQPGQPGEKGQGQPTPGQLAEKQAALLAATQALADSQAANQAAQAALDQAQVLAPSAVQPPLAAADAALGEAAAQLGQGQPMPAAASQGQALEALGQALAALNAQLAANGQPTVTPGEATPAQANAPQPGEGQGKEPGQGQGKEPGQGQGKEPGQGQGQEPGQGEGQEPGQGQGQKPGKAKEQNQTKGSGNREPDGMAKNAASQLENVKGGESFLTLPPKQRELIRQALSEGLPAEYSALIQQYYVNLARGRTANTPAVGEKKK